EVMRLMSDQLGQRTFSRAQPFVSENGFPSEFPPEGSTRSVAVALCSCSGEVGGVVDLAGVTPAEVLPIACQSAGLERLADLVRQSGARRLVVGACSHRTHEPLFQRLIAEAAINPYLVVVVNPLGHCARGP